MQGVQPQSSGVSSKVKVKVRVNLHGIFTVSSASMVEELEAVEDDAMEVESTDQKTDEKKEKTANAGDAKDSDQNDAAEAAMETDQMEEKKAESKNKEKVGKLFVFLEAGGGPRLLNVYLFLGFLYRTVP